MPPDADTVVDVRWYRWRQGRESGDRRLVKVRAGRWSLRRIVPPAGEAHAFDVVDWPYEVEVAVSPSGRKVRLHVNGHEVDLAPYRERKHRG